MIRLMVVEETGPIDPHLRAALQGAPDLQVVAELRCSADVPDAAARQRPDLLIMDPDTPEDPLALVREVLSLVPRCGVVLLTSRRSSRTLQRSLHARVSALLDRELPPADMVTLLRRVAAGERMVEPIRAAAPAYAEENPLSDREREVLRAASEGLQSKEIARRLFLAPGTVRNHVSAILRKTGTRSRWEAVRKAQVAGWI